MTKLKFLLIFLLFTASYLQAQWEIQLDNDNFTHLDRIFFLDQNNGWAIGGGTLDGGAGPYFYTTNGGEQWYLDDDWMNIVGSDIVFVNIDTGFIAAANGIIRKTTDGGQNWTDIQTPATQNVIHLFFVDENNGWATLAYPSNKILHTTDNGNTWETQQVFTINTSGVSSMFFIDTNKIFLGGAYYDISNDDVYHNIMMSNNQGNTWNTVYSVQNKFYAIYDIYFLNNERGLAVGQKSSINTYFLLKTEDGGENWEEQTLPDLVNFYGQTLQASIIYSIEFANDTLGWLTCADEYGSGYILLTTDAGETWKQQYVNRNLNVRIFDICATDVNNAWAVGGDYIYHNANADTIIIVGTEDIKKEVISISPNPFTENIKLQIPQEYQITNILITDISGKICYRKNQINNNQINLSFLKQGIYFLTIQLNNQIIQTQKIIKL